MVVLLKLMMMRMDDNDGEADNDGARLNDAEWLRAIFACTLPSVRFIFNK